MEKTNTVTSGEAYCPALLMDLFGSVFKKRGTLNGGPYN